MARRSMDISRPGASARRRGAAPGFTIVEVLAAIAIIVVLSGILISVGVGVLSGRKAAQTEAVLLTLDRALEEYFIAERRFPPAPDFAAAEFGLYAEIPGPGLNASDPQVRSADNVRYVRQPVAGVFVEQATGFGSVDAILQSLPTSVVSSQSRGGSDNGTYLRVVDAWEQPILYIHPENELAEEIYGRCPNDRPYFLSAGPDQKYGLTSESAFAEGLDEGTPAAFEAAIKYTRDNLTSVPAGEPVLERGSGGAYVER